MEFQNFYTYLRRQYYITFRKEYIKEQLKRRRGECLGHNCCSFSLSGLFMHRFIKECYSNTNKCLKQNNLPYDCSVCPFDEKDKNPLTKEICGFWFE